MTITKKMLGASKFVLNLAKRQYARRAKNLFLIAFCGGRLPVKDQFSTSTKNGLAQAVIVVSKTPTNQFPLAMYGGKRASESLTPANPVPMALSFWSSVDWTQKG